MIKVQTQSLDAHQWLHDIAEYLKADIKTDCQQKVLQVPSPLGEGSITAFAFQDGISLILLDCLFYQEFQITYLSQTIHPLQFHFCLKGDFRHTLCDGALTYQLNPYAGAISANPGNCTQELVFPKDVRVVHASLQVNRKEYLNKIECDLDKMPERLANTFRDVKGQHSFMYQGNYSIASGDCINDMMKSDYTGLVKSAFEEAKSLELLSLQLKQYSDDSNPDVRPNSIKKFDLKQIVKARELLMDEMNDSPTIEELAKRVGINQQKLKAGFKKIYGQTINRYLRNARLERARYLILQDKGSIGEIAQIVGYSNQSHFARRFKEKFGILPKDLAKASRC